MVHKYDSMYIQALDIISSMGLSPQPASEGSPMYVFEYKNATMFIDEGESDHDIDLSCSVYLSGTEGEQKQILNDAKDMAEDDLTEFDIQYIGDGLAFIALYLRVKESRHKLYKKHLFAMMDKLIDGYITISCAISLVKITFMDAFKKHSDMPWLMSLNAAGGISSQQLWKQCEMFPREIDAINIAAMYNVVETPDELEIQSLIDEIKKMQGVQ